MCFRSQPTTSSIRHTVIRQPNLETWLSSCVHRRTGTTLAGYSVGTMALSPFYIAGVVSRSSSLEVVTNGGKVQTAVGFISSALSLRSCDHRRHSFAYVAYWQPSLARLDLATDVDSASQHDARLLDIQLSVIPAIVHEW